MNAVAQDASERLGSPARYAFASLLTSDAYLPGALVLAHSLRATQPSETPNGDKWQLVCLCTPATLRIQSIKALRHVYDVVVAVEPLSFAGIVADRIAHLDQEQQHPSQASSSSFSQQQQSEKTNLSARLLLRRIREKAHHNLALLGRPDLGEGAGAALTKLHLWRLKAYQRVVYMDADMIALVSLLHHCSVPRLSGSLTHRLVSVLPPNFF